MIAVRPATTRPKQTEHVDINDECQPEEGGAHRAMNGSRFDVFFVDVFLGFDPYFQLRHGPHFLPCPPKQNGPHDLRVSSSDTVRL